MIAVRPVRASDVPALVEIRTHYVLHTHSTFDTTPPTAEDMTRWLAHFDKNSAYQCLVAVGEDDEVLGYAATSQYRPKPAFDGTVEMTVYLQPDIRVRGAGSLLYAELFARAERHGTRTFLAGIALPNDASLAFHRKHGFVEVGTFVDYAHKHGVAISSTWMQRRVPIGP